MNRPIPPAPPGWNKTIKDLSDEMQRGERKWVGSPEVDWARDYERGQIPANMRFPRKGDIYEVLDDMEVYYITSWAAPYTGGGNGILKKGDRVIVDADPMDSRPISVYVSAVDYDAVEKRIVPISESSEPKYRGFYFCLKTVDLNRKFKLIIEPK